MSAATHLMGLTIKYIAVVTVRILPFLLVLTCVEV